jgi:molybdopterin synthase catalytic subunit
VEARLSQQPLCLEDLLATAEHRDCGGLAIFAGTVRDHHEGRAVIRLRYTAYAPLAERLLRAIERRAVERFGAPHCRVAHRLGTLEIGDVAVYCVARAPHRDEAFAACRYLIEEIKRTVPIWKEEFYADGTSAFVEGCSIQPEPV